MVMRYTFDTTTPSSDFSVTGLKNSDTVDSVTLAAPAQQRRRRSWRQVRPMRLPLGARLEPVLGNYIISYTPGTLTITQAALTVTANNVSKTYGSTYTFDTTTPSIDFSVSGLKNSDTVNSVALNSAGAAGTATFVAPGPTYAITVGSALGTGSG